PLGGNRKGPVRTYINLFIVMFLGGLWHGAAWSYAIWGAAHGVFLALERALGAGKSDITPGGRWRLEDGIRHLTTFSIVSALWLLFKLPNFRDVIEYAKCLYRNPWGFQLQGLYVISLFSLPII